MMAANSRRALDVADTVNMDPPPPMVAKRRIHSEDDPLPAPSQQSEQPAPKRVKKTVRDASNSKIYIQLMFMIRFAAVTS